MQSRSQSPKKNELSREELVTYLADPRAFENAQIRKRACDIMQQEVGRTVFLRGLIECSNHCRKNCFYCGIRRDQEIHRYSMSQEEILACAAQAESYGYGSIVLQCGERNDAPFIDFIEELLRALTQQRRSNLGITLSLGEQEEETYRRWFDAGAHRYLLRIETSRLDLYRKLHPADHRFDLRLRCLQALREIGYQVGTGIMIGLPFQTPEDLADDILFFREMDVDMIGMGPYIPHEQTPLASEVAWHHDEPAQRLELALRVVALTRIMLPDSNIAAATALDALHPRGRLMALESGANVFMPNLTPKRYRQDYLLYEGKPCIDEDAQQCRSCVERRILSLNREIGWNARGDALRFTRRHQQTRS